MPKKIVFVIDENGDTKRDFIGFEGDTCFKEAKAIDHELDESGIVIEGREIRKKPEAERVKERV